MVVYLDLVFVLNCLSDALALYITARLSAVALRMKRMILGALLGGAYAVAAAFPKFLFLTSFSIQILAAILLVRFVFGHEKMFLRLCVLFYILSCTIGGAMLAISQCIHTNRFMKTMEALDWKVFLLAGVICYFLLSVVFRSGAAHAIRGQIFEVSVSLGGRAIRLNALHDTGHSLCDPYNGMSVLTVWHEVLYTLWTREEKEIFDQFAVRGSIWCAEKLGEVSPGKFRLIPYRAVGIDCAMLLAVQADEVYINRENHGGLTLALSPTPLSDGEGYTALWGGERKEISGDVLPNKDVLARDFVASGHDLSG